MAVYSQSFFCERKKKKKKHQPADLFQVSGCQRTPSSVEKFKLLQKSISKKFEYVTTSQLHRIGAKPRLFAFLKTRKIKEQSEKSTAIMHASKRKSSLNWN